MQGGLLTPADRFQYITGLLGAMGTGLAQHGLPGIGQAAMQFPGQFNQGLLQRRIADNQDRALKMQEAAATREQAKFDKESRAEDAMRLALTGDYTGGLLGPDMPRAEGMAPAGGLLAKMPAEYRGFLQAGAQADPKGAYTTALSLMTQPKTATVAKGATLIDTRTNKPIYENKDDDALSPIAKLQSDLKAGRITPEQYQIGVSKMGPAQTTVNVGNKELDKEAAKFYADVQKGAFTASAALPKIARGRQLLATIQQGKFQPTVQEAKRVLKDLGINMTTLAGLKDDVGAAQALDALMTDIRLDIQERLKGQTSDREQADLKGAVARLGNTPEGNLMILDQLESIATRTGKQAEVLRSYRKKNNGTIDAGVYDAIVEAGVGAEPPPLRTAAEAQSQAAPKQPPPGARTATNPQTKERVWYDEQSGAWVKF